MDIIFMVFICTYPLMFLTFFNISTKRMQFRQWQILTYICNEDKPENYFLYKQNP